MGPLRLQDTRLLLGSHEIFLGLGMREDVCEYRIRALVNERLQEIEDLRPLHFREHGVQIALLPSPLTSQRDLCTANRSRDQLHMGTCGPLACDSSLGSAVQGSKHVRWCSII